MMPLLLYVLESVTNHVQFITDSTMASFAPSVVGASTEGIASGTIRWEFEKDSVSTDNCFSPETEVGGMKWTLSAQMMDDGYLGLFLHLMEGDYTVRSADVSFEIKLINHDDESKTVKCKVDEKYFVPRTTDWGYLKVIKWDDLTNESTKGFIKNNKFAVQFDITISEIVGFSFTEPNEPSHDIVLVIEGKKVYVSKQYLSILSPVFHTMFYGDFAEKNQEEIELKDVDYTEFCEMLNVLYPPHKNISDGNFEYLLKLGDRFETNKMMEQVEQFLITSSSQSVASLLIIADRYCLYKLTDHCFDQLKTTEDVIALKKSHKAKNFTDAIKASLYDHIAKVSV